MKENRKAKWPAIHTRTYPTGTASYQVDLGMVNGVRQRIAFSTHEEAKTYAAMARTKRQNEGMLAFAMPNEVRVDAWRAHEILHPHGVSMEESAKYYTKHVINYQAAPIVPAIVDSLIATAKQNRRRPSTISDLKHRLTRFATAFPNNRLSDIGVEEITAWTTSEGWTALTTANYLTKVSQLFNHAIHNSWVEKNPVHLIQRPAIDEKEPGILTVEEAMAILTKANSFGLLPYIAIGLFAGVRSAELLRLDWKDIQFDDRSIVIGASVSKKRSRRALYMEDALLTWLDTIKRKTSGPIVDTSKFRHAFDQLRTAAKVKPWPQNALRHSFASYHLAHFRDSRKTADALGHGGIDILHKHYKSLVLRKDAERFWQLRPMATPVAA